jgi:hypothetical protein
MAELAATRGTATALAATVSPSGARVVETHIVERRDRVNYAQPAAPSPQYGVAEVAKFLRELEEVRKALIASAAHTMPHVLALITDTHDRSKVHNFVADLARVDLLVAVLRRAGVLPLHEGLMGKTDEQVLYLLYRYASPSSLTTLLPRKVTAFDAACSTIELCRDAGKLLDEWRRTVAMMTGPQVINAAEVLLHHWPPALAEIVTHHRPPPPEGVTGAEALARAKIDASIGVLSEFVHLSVATLHATRYFTADAAADYVDERAWRLALTGQATQAAGRAKGSGSAGAAAAAPAVPMGEAAVAALAGGGGAGGGAVGSGGGGGGRRQLPPPGSDCPYYTGPPSGDDRRTCAFSDAKCRYRHAPDVAAANLQRRRAQAGAVHWEDEEESEEDA